MKILLRLVEPFQSYAEQRNEQIAFINGIQEPKNLGVFVIDVQASGFWASGGLGPSKIAFGRAGGPRLGLDTSLIDQSTKENSHVAENTC